MKIEKNKIVFALIILCVVLFIGAYSVMMLGDEEEPVIENNLIPVPELEDQQKEYKSKLEALDDLKEVREANAPSIYDERLLDSTGFYDPDLLDKEKIRIVDSIYNEGRISYSDRSFRQSPTRIQPQRGKMDSIIEVQAKTNETSDPKKLSLEHQLFFASNPQEALDITLKNTDSLIYVRVDGTQTVQANYRLQMRLAKDARIGNKIYTKHTPLYGFISFKPNRTLIKIENIDHNSVDLKAFDFEDGSEGLYVVNSFRAEASQKVIGDIVDDINVAGVPQVGGVKKIFQRNNRNVKVTITDNYKLILKPEL